MSEPTFVKGLILKTHTFENGGEIIKLSFKLSEFYEFVKEHKNGDWLNIDVKTSKKGIKYAMLNEWKKQDTTAIEDVAIAGTREAKAKVAEKLSEEISEVIDLPF